MNTQLNRYMSQETTVIINMSLIEQLVAECKQSQQEFQKLSQQSSTIIEQMTQQYQRVVKIVETCVNLIQSKETQPVIIKVNDPLDELKKVQKEFNFFSTYTPNPVNKKEYSSFLTQLVDIVSLYETKKISATFKEMFLDLFHQCLKQEDQRRDDLKHNILKIRDIRWLLLEMERYPIVFSFDETDLEIMKHGSRDNISLVKKICHKSGEMNEYYTDEENEDTNEDTNEEETKNGTKNSSKIRCTYSLVNGQLDGEYIKYYPNGTIMCHTFYKNGILHGPYTVFMDNKDLVSECIYVDGKINGIYKRYFRGKLMSTYNYIDNELDGEHIGYDPILPGAIAEIITYKQGKKHGFTKYFRDNVCFLEEVYENDIRIDFKVFNQV